VSKGQCGSLGQMTYGLGKGRWAKRRDEGWAALSSWAEMAQELEK
jgi:hypothetical protein